LESEISELDAKGKRKPHPKSERFSVGSVIASLEAQLERLYCECPEVDREVFVEEVGYLAEHLRDKLNEDHGI
jgi:hypothetical protein